MSAFENMQDWLAHFKDCDQCRRGDRDPHMRDQRRCDDGQEIAKDYVDQVDREARRPR